MGSAPFAGRRSEAETPPASGRAASLPFTSDVPEGWEAVPARQFQVAAYEVRDGSRKASVSVSSAGGDVTANVNRWRGQIGLAPLDAAQIADQAQKIDIGGHGGMLVELV